mgnify:CR=1 FL=1
MLVEMVVVGALETNCYIISAGKEAREVIIIDPGADKDTILDAVGDRTIKAVMLTHGHFDHTGALDAFSKYPIYIHKEDAPMLSDTRLNGGYLVGDGHQRPEATRFYKEWDVVDLANMHLKVLETPGHTMGSVCILEGDQMLTGDTLFKGDYGRTDLAGGSATLMRESLRRLFSMHGIRIWPGHGDDDIIR